MSKDIVFVKMFVEGLREGHYAKLSPQAFKTLVMLGSFVGEDGTCFPNQKKLAEMAGVSERTVRRHIDEILSFKTPKGNPIMTIKKKKSKSSDYYYNEYKFHEEAIFGFGKGVKVDKKNVTVDKESVKVDQQDVSQLSYKENQSFKRTIKRTKEEDNSINNTNDKDVFTLDTTNLKSKDIISYFRFLYEKKYGIPYQMTGKDWGKFGNIINNKVLGQYSGELIVAGVEVLVNEYDDHFGNKDFPRPNLWNFGNWVFQKAVEIAQDKDTKKTEQKERFEKEQKEAEKKLEGLETEEDFKALLDRMNKRNNREF